MKKSFYHLIMGLVVLFVLVISSCSLMMSSEKAENSSVKVLFSGRDRGRAVHNREEISCLEIALMTDTDLAYDATRIDVEEDFFLNGGDMKEAVFF